MDKATPDFSKEVNHSQEKSENLLKRNGFRTFLYIFFWLALFLIPALIFVPGAGYVILVLPHILAPIVILGAISAFLLVPGSDKSWWRIILVVLGIILSFVSWSFVGMILREIF